MILKQLLNNTPAWCAVLAWFIAQVIKFTITFALERKIDFSKFYASGGMPSSHTAFVSALAVSIGLKYGFDTPSFAVSFAMACIVMYDAAGVRRAAGIHAEVINEILRHTNLASEKKLKELLGHTPIQVLCGCVLGIVIAVIFGI